MAKGKKHTPEQIVSLLRQIEVAVANGKTTPIACREGGITEQTYYRWRKEYGGLQVDQARRLKELEQENAKLKRLVLLAPSGPCGLLHSHEHPTECPQPNHHRKADQNSRIVVMPLDRGTGEAQRKHDCEHQLVAAGE